MSYKITVLAGDGIGKEITAAAKRVLARVAEIHGFEITFDDRLIGGAAIDECGTPLPEDTVQSAQSAHGVLLGAVGGDKWDNLPVRPENALLGIRRELGLYANLRPAKLFKALKDRSALKESTAQKGIDLIFVRELTGGIYFGERGYSENGYGRAAYDTECYGELEIERVARIAYELAESRTKRLCSVDKANVLTSSKLWRKVVSDINCDYPDVTLTHLYVDNAAMQLVLNPSQFDVILTSNMFGDILSDLAAATVGSIGVMPSASLGATNLGMYEAIHGSAPSLAGLDVANPVGTILSAAMLLRHSCGLDAAALSIENAVAATLSDGFGTADIGGNLSTTAMTDEIVRRL